MKPKKIALIFLGILVAALAAGCDATSGGTETSSKAPETLESSSFTPPDPAAVAKREEAAAKEQEAQKKPGSASSTSAPGATPPKAGDDVAVIETNYGRIVLKFFPSKAPGHVKNFITLAKKKFYDGTKFHRIIPGFMIQGGDPNSRTGEGRVGTGGPGYMIKAEFNDIHHGRGILSMARSQDPDSAGSQFFITVADASFLDRQYSAFGQVIEGMDVVDKIVALPRNEEDRPTPDEAIMKTVRIEKWPLKK
jgi:cyclophilin family peptidyl-prolyl cis-trans isomerase